MIAKIIPIAKLPRKLDCFDYIAPKTLEKKLRIGHIVVVSFHGQKKYGLVCGITDKTDCNGKLLPVAAITDLVVPETFIKLLFWLVEYYAASPSLFCQFLIPPPPRRQITVPTIIPCGCQKKILLSKQEAQNTLASLRNASIRDKTFIYDNNPQETAAFFIKLIQKHLRGNKQILFLVPSPDDFNYFLPIVNEYFKDALIVWRSKMAKGERFAKWREILRGERCVVFGTRTAVFLPFINLSLLLLCNASSRDYKQWDMNPRYDARKVAEKIATDNRIQIVFSDITPSLEIYNGLRTAQINAANEPMPRPLFTLVDLQKEKNNKYPLFSYPLHRLISEAAAANKKVIIFLNRKEKDSALFCLDCSHISKCPSCQRPCSVDKTNIFCYHCKTKENLPLTCEKCGNSRLKALMMGVDSFGKIIRNDFPSLKISVLPEERAEFIPDFDVLIATDAFWQSDWPRRNRPELYGIAIADFDSYLIRPDLSRKENALWSFERFLQFGKKTGAQKILVQTSCPENSIFQSPLAFYGEELAERATSGYPPFKKLIKIICKEKNQAKLREKSAELYGRLLQNGYSASPPFEPFIKKRTKNFIMHIIIKCDIETNITGLKMLVPDHYQIDADPISLV